MSIEIIATSTPQIENHNIDRYVGFASADYAMRPNKLKNMWNNFVASAGKRSAKHRSEIDDTRELCIDLLKQKAFFAGANAIVDLEMRIYNLGGEAPIVIVTGTLVICREVPANNLAPVTSLEDRREPAAEKCTNEAPKAMPLEEGNLPSHLVGLSMRPEPSPSHSAEKSAEGIEEKGLVIEAVDPVETVIEPQTDSTYQQQAKAASAFCALPGRRLNDDPSA